LVIGSEEIGKAIPEISDDAAAWAVRIAAVLGAVVATIRRVTPVLPAERGLLPAGGAPGGALAMPSLLSRITAHEEVG
ncbi:hypothetical protein, partial [Pseudomonas aeruginosa]|uniref:hypothetical protein n=1 Tax=Pseudomonas aeruginosa TaxID=287 RepID=UPI003457EB97